MMSREVSNSPGARALRLAGYVKSPSFWVTQEQYDLILWMAQQNKEKIEAIKEKAYGR
jgi:hypothetical protein